MRTSLEIAGEEEYEIQRSGKEADGAIQQQATDFSELFSQHFFFVFTFAVLIRTPLSSSQKTQLVLLL